MTGDTIFGLIWMGSGLFAWGIMAFLDMKNRDENYSIGEDPDAGQALILSLLVGPIVLMMVIGMLFLPKSEEEIRRENMTEDEAYTEAYLARIKEDNDHAWEIYTHTRDKEDRDEIVDIDKVVVPLEEKPFIRFHGGCGGCPLQKETIKNCWTCMYYPGNWRTHKSRNPRER